VAPAFFAGAALVMLMAGAAAAQFGGGFGGFGPRYVPARFPDADTFGHGFVFCRGIYRSDRREAGGTGWSTDYPDAELNFSIRLSELTKARIFRGTDGKPVHVTVRLTDDALFKCPYLHMEDVGTMALSDEEARKLREYLLKGGFLWVDDFWGTRAWTQWAAQIARVLPEFPILDVAPDDPIDRGAITLFLNARQPPNLLLHAREQHVDRAGRASPATGNLLARVAGLLAHEDGSLVRRQPRQELA